MFFIAQPIFKQTVTTLVGKFFPHTCLSSSGIIWYRYWPKVSDDLWLGR